MNMRRSLIAGVLLLLLAGCVSSRQCDGEVAEAKQIAESAAREAAAAHAEAAAARAETDLARDEAAALANELHAAQEQLATIAATVPVEPDPDAEERQRDFVEAVPERAVSGGREVHVVRLFYATDRRATGSDVPMDFYDSGRSAELQFGTCIVSVPYQHKPGTLETERWTHLEFVPDVTRDVVLLTVRPAAREMFLADLKARIARTPSKSALVFIHGYNVSFSTAARRTAQIAYDIGFDGVPVVYSWPSHGTLRGYLGDEGNARWTTNHLRQFLQQLAERSGATSIHIIAHSMGNRPLVDALERLATSKKKVFDSIVLTAPDVDSDVLADVAAQIRTTARTVTLYASDTDKALHASRLAHSDQRRAGEAGANLMVLDGIDTVDATDMDTGFFALGHSYVGDDTLAVTDLRKLIVGRLPPERRGLQRLVRASRTFWRLLSRAPAPR
jgi:esterase/lipase superfamily enzyme